MHFVLLEDYKAGNSIAIDLVDSVNGRRIVVCQNFCAGLKRTGSRICICTLGWC